MCVDILSPSDCERSNFLHSGQAAQTNKPSSLESSFLNIWPFSSLVANLAMLWIDLNLRLSDILKLNILCQHN